MKTNPNVVACGLIFEQPTTGNQDNSVGGGEGVYFLISVTLRPVYRDDLCLAILPLLYPC